MIRALIFDFDGLILDTETVLIDSYQEIHARHGVPFDRTSFLRSVGHADYSFDPWHGFSPHDDRAELEKERQVRKNELLLQLQVLPGVGALLDAARARGLRIGLASNSHHDWVEPHLKRRGLHDRFEFFACRGDTPSPKPEPDLYKLVLNHFGLRGHEAIAFEDSATGVLAAKRAHLWVVAVPNPSTAHHDLSLADRQVSSLAEVSLDRLLEEFRLPNGGT